MLPSSFDVVREGACADSMTVAAEARWCRRRPNVGDRDAGSIWMQCLTAWGALVEIAEIGAGDWVVVPGRVELGRDRVDPALPRPRRAA